MAACGHEDASLPFPETDRDLYARTGALARTNRSEALRRDDGISDGSTSHSRRSPERRKKLRASCFWDRQLRGLCAARLTKISGCRPDARSKHASRREPGFDDEAAGPCGRPRSEISVSL